MSRGSKLAIGFLSFLPAVLVVGLLITMFMQFNQFIEFRDSHPEPSEFFRMFGRIFILELIMFMVSIGVLVFFIVHLSRNKNMESTEKAIWVLALVLGNVICYPVYWFMKIWKDE